LKKIGFISIGLIIVISLSIYLVFQLNGGKSASSPSDNILESGEHNPDENNDESEELDPIQAAHKERLKQYEEAGSSCKEITDKIKRGDCFRDVNSQFLIWYIDESKSSFYFPFQHSYTEWIDVLYFTIDENDNLGEVQKTEFYNDYKDPTILDGDHYARAIETIEEYWYIFSNMFPKEYRQYLKHIYWVDTGQDSIFGVHRDPNVVQDTRLMISHNVKEYNSEKKHTLIHEFAHVLTLSEDQVPVKSAEIFFSEDESVFEPEIAACGTYYHWGCLNETSYFYLYYKEFWKDLMSDYEKIDWNAENDYKDFFYKYEEHFFNSYQGTDPAEDMADNFQYFVMMNSSEVDKSDELKYKKVKFFYNFDELVELRTKILENIYEMSLKDEFFY